MSTHANAEALLTWLHGRASATLDEIVESGLMKPRTASAAIQYAVKCGAIERIDRAGAGTRVRYRVTGSMLPLRQSQTALTSFDELLQAWGMVREPIPLSVTESRQHQISDG